MTLLLMLPMSCRAGKSSLFDPILQWAAASSDQAAGRVEQAAEACSVLLQQQADLSEAVQSRVHQQLCHALEVLQDYRSLQERTHAQKVSYFTLAACLYAELPVGGLALSPSDDLQVSSSAAQSQVDALRLAASMQQGNWKAAQEMLDSQHSPATVTAPAWQLLSAEYAAGKLASRGRSISQDPDATQAAQRAQQTVQGCLAAQALPDSTPCFPAQLARLSRVQALLKSGRPNTFAAQLQGTADLQLLIDSISDMVPASQVHPVSSPSQQAGIASLDIALRSRWQQAPSAAFCTTLLTTIADQGLQNPGLASRLQQILSTAVLPPPPAHKGAKPVPTLAHLEPYVTLLRLSQLGLALQSGQHRAAATRQLSMHICRQLGQALKGPGKAGSTSRAGLRDSAQAALSGACVTLVAWAAKHPEVVPSQQHLPSFAGQALQEEAARHAAAIPAAGAKHLQAQVCCLDVRPVLLNLR